jgi:hypothetical protein
VVIQNSRKNYTAAASRRELSRPLETVTTLWAYNRHMSQKDLVIVQAFGTQADADLAKATLESAGIDAMVQADTAGGMRPHLAWSGLGFRVLVREEDQKAARDVLSPAEDSELVLVQAFGTQDQADAATEKLFTAGIPVTVQDDSATGWRPGAVWGGSGYRMLVPKEDVERARQVLGLP